MSCFHAHLFLCRKSLLFTFWRPTVAENKHCGDLVFTNSCCAVYFFLQISPCLFDVIFIMLFNQLIINWFDLVGYYEWWISRSSVTACMCNTLPCCLVLLAFKRRSQHTPNGRGRSHVACTEWKSHTLPPWIPLSSDTNTAVHRHSSAHITHRERSAEAS